MAYNIQIWRTEHLDNLRIPLAGLLQPETPPEGKLERQNRDDGTVLISYEDTWDDSGLNEIVGTIVEDTLLVESILCETGVFYFDVLHPVLEKSAGVLEFICVWYYDDQIVGARVKDGVFENLEVELRGGTVGTQA